MARIKSILEVNINYTYSPSLIISVLINDNGIKKVYQQVKEEISNDSIMKVKNNGKKLNFEEASKIFIGLDPFYYDEY